MEPTPSSWFLAMFTNHNKVITGAHSLYIPCLLGHHSLLSEWFPAEFWNPLLFFKRGEQISSSSSLGEVVEIWVPLRERLCIPTFHDICLAPLTRIGWEWHPEMTFQTMLGWWVMGMKILAGNQKVVSSSLKKGKVYHYCTYLDESGKCQ